MSNTNFTQLGENNNMDCFKEAVCVDVGRIYDSCSDKY